MENLMPNGLAVKTFSFGAIDESAALAPATANMSAKLRMDVFVFMTVFTSRYWNLKLNRMSGLPLSANPRKSGAMKR